MGWSKRSICDLLKCGAIKEIQDGNHGEKHPIAADYVNSGVPFIMAGDLIEGRINFENCKFISKKQADQLRVGFSRSGDVLLSHKGVGLGKVAIVPEIPDYIMLTPQVTYYRVNNEQLNNIYLSYAFKHPHFQKMLENFSAQSTRPYIGITDQRYLEIYFPDIIIQRKIAGILFIYDYLIESNNRCIKILEEMVEHIYREWFVHFRFPGYKDQRVEESGLRIIPEGWEVGSVGDIAGLRNEKYVEKDHRHLPLLDLSRIPRRSCCITEFGKSDEITTSRIIFDEGDILFGSIRPYFHKVAYCPFKGITNISVFVIKPNPGYTRSFIFSLLFSDKTVSWSSQHSSGTKMPVIKWDVFKNMEVVIPPSNYLKKYEEIASPILAEIITLIKKNQNLRQIRDYLLPNLISGKIDVSELDIDFEVMNELYQ